MTIRATSTRNDLGAEEIVAANSRTVRALERIVAHRLSAGRFASAAAWVRVAASFSTTNPTGQLRSPVLEGALDEISRHTLADPSTDGRAAGLTTGSVLHVLSEAHLIGGHVRLATRWAELDNRTPSFVVTRPGFGAAGLDRIASVRGGRSFTLTGPSLVARASRLRELTSGFEVVVCHTHPDDPVPGIAFGGSYRGAPVITVNHADQVFWLGTGNVSSLANLRQSDDDAKGRAYPPENRAFLPIPVTATDRAMPRDEAKRKLGIDPATPVLLTLARSMKFTATPQHPGFIEVVEHELRNHEHVVLMAVGPEPTDPDWAGLVQRLGPRIVVPGPQPDPQVHLDAADIYLDSFPWCSNTSMLEAAARGVPVLAARLWQGMQRLLSSEGMLGDAPIPATGVDEYRRTLATLLADDARQLSSGRRAREALLALHAPDRWLEHLERLYEHARTAPPTTSRDEPVDYSEHEMVRYATALLGVELRTPLLWTLNTVAESFDLRDATRLRLRIAALRAARRARSAGPGVGAADADFLLPRS